MNLRDAICDHMDWAIINDGLVDVNLLNGHTYSNVRMFWHEDEQFVELVIERKGSNKGNVFVPVTAIASITPIIGEE